MRTFLFLLALLLAAPAGAQQFDPDSGVPTVIDADVLDYAPGVTILSGQVDVRQGDVRILADRMNLYSRDESVSGGNTPISDVSRIVAEGNFYYITPEQEVKGERGVYLADDDTFTVTGNVLLLQGENVVSGERLIYDLKTDEARVVGTCEGRKCGGRGRVRILLKQTDQPAGQPQPEGAS